MPWRCSSPPMVPRGRPSRDRDTAPPPSQGCNTAPISRAQRRVGLAFRETAAIKSRRSLPERGTGHERETDNGCGIAGAAGQRRLVAGLGAPRPPFLLLTLRRRRCGRRRNRDNRHGAVRRHRRTPGAALPAARAGLLPASAAGLLRPAAGPGLCTRLRLPALTRGQPPATLAPARLRSLEWRIAAEPEGEAVMRIHNLYTDETG